MKKVTFFSPVARVAFAVLTASVIMVSCTKEELLRQPASNAMKSAFNAKLKLSGNEFETLDARYSSPPTDTTKKAQ